MDLIGSRQPYIDGKFVVGEGPELAVESPATEATIAQVETCSVRQTEEAILAARRSFDSGEWANTPAIERARAVNRMADYVESQLQAVIATLMAETGATRMAAEFSQGSVSVAHMRQTADLFLKLPEEEHNPRPISDVVGG